MSYVLWGGTGKLVGKGTTGVRPSCWGVTTTTTTRNRRTGIDRRTPSLLQSQAHAFAGKPGGDR